MAGWASPHIHRAPPARGLKLDIGETHVLCRPGESEQTSDVYADLVLARVDAITDDLRDSRVQLFRYVTRPGQRSPTRFANPRTGCSAFALPWRDVAARASGVAAFSTYAFRARTDTLFTP